MSFLIKFHGYTVVRDIPFPVLVKRLTRVSGHGEDLLGTKGRCSALSRWSAFTNLSEGTEVEELV